MSKTAGLIRPLIWLFFFVYFVFVLGYVLEPIKTQTFHHTGRYSVHFFKAKLREGFLLFRYTDYILDKKK
jgi:hypothetical protein